jgi:hypothetical protein
VASNIHAGVLTSQESQDIVCFARQEEKGSDEDSDSEAERRKVQQAKQQQVAAFTDVDNMDDEVERVLGHRWVQGLGCNELMYRSAARAGPQVASDGQACMSLFLPPYCAQHCY